MYRFLLLCWLGICTSTAFGQEKPAAAAATNKALPAPKRELQAVRITTQAPKLDGVLDEEVWQAAPVASQFYELEPTPGPVEKHATEVRVLYDDAAIYIGAVMHDVSQDSILRELSARDNIGNSDWFGVFLDTYNDHLNGYEFILTPGGVQVDARLSPTSGEDGNWNAVWDSRTTLRGTDWVAEMRIPYSAIRFSGAKEQVWGINFGRQRRSSRQKFFWNEVRPQVDGFVNQWGLLTGLRDLKPPLRLSLTPYVSAYVNHYPYNVEGKSNASTSFNGGADVKWGINESFTLDATLVPDFGQVQSDNQVLNLSPFEVQYNENRGFFTEGTELFNKGGLFYSRRVGATPIGFYGVGDQLHAGTTDASGRHGGEFIVENPGTTRLVNATKVSGRTGKGLGIGVFNAVSRDVFATLQDSTTGARRQVLTQPLSNYNIVVVDQSLKNNSYVSLINTNVTRAGTTYDANVTGGLFRFANKKNSYALDGRLIYSRRRGLQFGSTEEVDDRDGYKYYVNFAKISGNFNFSIDHGVESHTYNPNDLGLLFANNSISQSLNASYNIYKPFWKVNRLSTYGTLAYSTLQQSPRPYSDMGLYLGGNTTFTKNFLTTGVNFDLSPYTRDYFDPRRSPIGRYFVRKPATVGFNQFISSDYRKKFAYDINYSVRFFAADGDRTDRNSFSLTLSPRYRFSNKLSFIYAASYEVARNQIGYAGGLNSGEALDAPLLLAFGGADGDVLLGRRTVSTVTSTATGTYTFTNRMSFNIRLRHYVSNVHYRDFSRLHPGGEETPVAYERNRDNTFNAFNVDAVYSWWFAPGSQVSVVWKNASASFFEANAATPLYFDNLNNTINTPHNNSVSVKVLYYLDYLTLRRHRG